MEESFEATLTAVIFCGLRFCCCLIPALLYALGVVLGVWRPGAHSRGVPPLRGFQAPACLHDSCLQCGGQTRSKGKTAHPPLLYPQCRGQMRGWVPAAEKGEPTTTTLSASLPLLYPPPQCGGQPRGQDEGPPATFVTGEPVMVPALARWPGVEWDARREGGGLAAIFYLPPPPGIPLLKTKSLTHVFEGSTCNSEICPKIQNWTWISYN